MEGMSNTTKKVNKNGKIAELPMDHLPDLIWFKDKDLRYARVNRAFAKRLGFNSPKSFAGKKPKDFFSKKIAQRYQREDREALTKEKIIKKEDLFKNKKGKIVSFYTITGPTYDKKGRVSGIFGIARDVSELKRTQLELEQAADIVKNIQVGLHVYHLENIKDDKTLRMVSANPITEKFTGIAPESVIGRTLDENFPGLREKGIPQKYAQVVRTQKAVELEDIYYSDDRVIQGAFAVKVFPLPDNHVGVSFENITKKKQIENSLQKRGESLRSLVESMDDLVFSLDKDRVFLDFYQSEKNESLIVSPKDFVGKTFDKVLSPTMTKQLNDAINKLKKEKRPQRIEYNFKKDNKECYYCAKISARYDAEGKFDGVTIVSRDITGQKEAEQALKESEELHRITLSEISDAVFVTNKKGQFTFICPNAHNIFGYSGEEISKMGNISAILGGQSSNRKKLENSKEIKNIEQKIVDKGGQEHHILTNIKKVSIKEGSFLYTCHDITEKKNAQERLLEAYKHLGVINRRLSILLNLKRAGGRIQFEEIFKTIVETGLNLAGANACQLYFYSKETDEFHLMASEKKIKTKHKDLFHLNSLDKKTRRRLLSKNKIIQLSREELFLQNKKSAKKITVAKKLNYVLLIPIAIEATLWGVLMVGFENKEEIGMQELNFYDVLTSQAAVLLSEIS